MATLDPLHKAVIVEVDVDRTASTVDCTFTGFGTPTFAIVLWGQNSGPGGLRYSGWNNASFGVWSASGQWAVGISGENNTSISNTARASSSSACACIPKYDATANSVEYTGSAITDGIRLTKVTNAQAADKVIQVMLFRGSSIKNINVGFFDANGSTSATLNGAAGWTPNYALFGTIGQGSASTTNTDARWSVGWALENIDGVGTGTFKQGCISFFSGDNLSTTQVGSFISSNHIVAEQSTGAIQQVAGTGFSTTGINFTETFSSSCIVFFIAMELQTDLGVDPDMMIERFSNWSISEANGNLLKKTQATAKANNFCGNVLAFGVAVDAQNTDDKTGQDIGLTRVSFRDCLGTHGGIAWADQDAVSTTNTGGHTMGPWYWRMPAFNGAGAGRAWEGSFFDRVGGGELVLNDAYPPYTGFDEFFTVLAWGRGVREIYVGDELAGVYHGGLFDLTLGHLHPTKADVYIGTTKVYGDPDHDNP